MKRVLSVSLGSSDRDHKAQWQIGHEVVEVARIGTDGDPARFAEVMAENDGNVDVLSVGGTNIGFRIGERMYYLRDSRRLIAGIHQTPVVDGAGVKASLEPRTVEIVQERGIVDFTTKRVLVVCAVDRYALARKLNELAKEIIFGDLMFALGLPIPLRSWGTLNFLIRVLLPLIVQMPIKWLYPSGEAQRQIRPKWRKYFAWADVIAGDFHFIRRSLPDRLDHKIIVTNTTTAQDTELLRRRGLDLLITATPELAGRSYGTNVMEAAFLAVAGKTPAEMRAEDYIELAAQVGWEPRIEHLQAT